MLSSSSLMGSYPDAIKARLSELRVGGEYMNSSGRFHPRAEDLRSRLAEAFRAFPPSNERNALSRFRKGLEFEFVSGFELS